MTGLLDPESGRELLPAGPGLLTDGGPGRWPVVDGIPWLRVGRPALRAAAVAAVETGEVDRARALLLTDADDWWGEPPPPPAAVAAAVAAGTLREAMAALGMGRVGDYFAHRWTDPTYLAGLALIGGHWPGERPVLEVACGIGHYLRELALRGLTDLTGLDVVFAKLWLARRFVVPAAVRLVCCDVQAGWPVPTAGAYVCCIDALYFLPDKSALPRSDADALVVGHAHNALVDTLSAGAPLTPGQYADLLGATTSYADEELTAALLAGRPPKPASDAELAATEAVSLVARAAGPPAPVDLAVPVPGRPLRRNPLYGADGVRRWPSKRWGEEYGARAGGYLPERWPGDLPPAALARRRLLLDLPGAW